MKRKLFLFLLVGLAISLAGLQSAQALEFGLNYEYSNGTPPEGASPWITATFEDSPENEKYVRLTMTATNLVDQEFISGWWFNFRDDLDQFADLLDYNPIDTSAVGGEIAFSSGENFDKAGPDGKFDLLFEFPTSNSENAWKRFTAGETVIVDLFLLSFDLSPSDFNFESDPGKEEGDKGPFFSAAHIQGIGEDNNLSGWIAPATEKVPESSTLLLVGVGLIGLAGFGRRRFKA